MADKSYINVEGGFAPTTTSSSPKSEDESLSSTTHAKRMSTKHPSSLGLKRSLSKAFLSSGMPVTFKDIVYTVVNSQNRKEKIQLLKGVSGVLKAGEMSALMGPSGSGKTTLLDVLAGRKTVGEMTGDIKYGGEKPSRMFLRRYTGT